MVHLMRGFHSLGQLEGQEPSHHWIKRSTPSRRLSHPLRHNHPFSFFKPYCHSFRFSSPHPSLILNPSLNSISTITTGIPSRVIPLRLPPPPLPPPSSNPIVTHIAFLVSKSNPFSNQIQSQMKRNYIQIYVITQISRNRYENQISNLKNEQSNPTSKLISKIKRNDSQNAKEKLTMMLTTSINHSHKFV